jgi:gliding motility-associated protein GldL
MSQQKGGFQAWFYGKIAPIITGLGASVVIIGALFKIQHWDGAGEMLTIGLGTEAILFALFAFAPQPHDPAWERVYPELDDDFYAKNGAKKLPVSAGPEKSAVKSIDEMMSQAKIDQTMIERLGTGFKSLSDNVSKMGDIANASVATKSYADNVSKASAALVDMNSSYAATVKSMSEMSAATADAKAFHTQVQTITKNLGALNAVYEMEINDANNHLKAMNQFNSGLQTALVNMTEAAKGTDQFKGELSKLTGNLTSLNNVYGNMLSAMRGGVQNSAPAAAPTAAR